MPITDDDLHAWIDGELSHERMQQVASYLAAHPDEAQRVAAWRAQNEALRALYDPILDDSPPPRLLRAVLQPQPAQRSPRRLLPIAACVALALVSGITGWALRAISASPDIVWQHPAQPLPAAVPTAGFVQRAAVAHAVYAVDERRPVEIDAAHEAQLVKWLSKRMGAPMNPPHLQAVGYSLEGGRLLPGGSGPVAQFMYQDRNGKKLTLYVSDERTAHRTEPQGSTAFQFARQGNISVFYWIDRGFGYALSAEEDKAELARVSNEVWRQLTDDRREK